MYNICLLFALFNVAIGKGHSSKCSKNETLILIVKKMLLRLDNPLKYHINAGSIKKKISVTQYGCDILHSMVFLITIFSFQGKWGFFIINW